MSRVGFGEAINYGFSLMAYFVLVIVVGGGIAFVGALIGGGGMAASQSSESGIIWLILGFLITIFGWLIIAAGMYGTFYKVIADAVNRGTNTPIAITHQTGGLHVASAPHSQTQSPPYRL